MDEMGKNKLIISEKWTSRAPTFDEEHSTENLEVWRCVLEELIGGKGNGVVLDVGTGTGFLANMIAEIGYESIGIDFSEGMLEIGRKNSAARGNAVTYILEDGDNIPFNDNYFDSIVNCRVVWTLLDPVKAFREWMRALKPSGILLSFIKLSSKEERAHWRAEKPQNQYPEELYEFLPLHAAPLDKYLEAYQDAGFINPAAILLRPDLGTMENGRQWYALKGVKGIERN
jgi:ubiquinone/menaquinone biosynthesis C-methylase UbiE